MSEIVVRHRDDGLLQRSVARTVPEDMKGTFVGRVTIPTHVALLAFLENKEKPVIGKHDNFENLMAILEQWPEFANQNGIARLDNAFKQIEIVRNMNALATPGGMGGPFVIALYQNIVG